MSNLKMLIYKVIKQFLIIVFCFVSFLEHANAISISIKCKKWEKISFITTQKLSEDCEFFRKGKPIGIFPPKFAPDELKCTVDRCIEWVAIAEYNELYKDMIKSIDDNSTDFRDRIIKMLDTVTLQKLYDPNLITMKN